MTTEGEGWFPSKLPLNLKRLQIRLFGEPRFAFDNEPWRFAAPPRALPLLANLLLRSGERVSRARLAATLWPDELDDTARSNLRRHLHRITAALPAIDGVSWLVSDNATVGWNEASPSWIDVVEFERLVANPATMERAVESYRGDLLEGLYEDWIIAERERLRSIALTALYDLAVGAKSRRDYAEAIARSERILSIDEWREDALRIQMSARYELGDRSAALAMYERFAHRLRSEMRIDPMPETTALRDTILANIQLAESSGEAVFDSVPGSRRAFSPPFVGRDEAIATLRSGWMRAARKSGSTVFVTGEPGIGKSRLATELAAVVEAQGGRVLTGATSSPESMPYQPLIDALRRGLPYLAAATVDPLWLCVVAPLMPEVLSLRPGIAVAEAIDPDHARTRLHETFARLFECIAQTRPLLLILEDLHWAQADTIDALAVLARRAGGMPLFIAATHRDDIESGHPVRECRRTLQRERRAIALALPRLSADDVAQVVSQTPATDGCPAELAPLIYRLSEGNPLFASQLLESFLETRELPESAGTQHIGDAIAARIERLEPHVRMVADVASTIGREFSAELVSQVGGFGEDAVLDALGSLMDRRLVREIGAAGYEYAFTHMLVAKTVYAATSPGLRAARHRRIAQCLERLPDSGTSFATVARHWKLAGDRDRSFAAFVHAARRAMEVYARADATEYAREARALCGDDQSRAYEALRLLSQAQQHHGDVEAWNADLQDLEAVTGGLGDEERFFSLEMRERYFFQTGDREAQRRVIDSMQTLANRAESLQWRTKALDALGMLEIGVGDFRKAIAPLREALAAAVSIANRRATLRARQHFIQALMRTGAMDEARSMLNEQRAQCADGSAEERLDLLWAESSLALATEDAVELRRVGTEMLELSTRFGDEDLQGKSHWMIGSAATSRHDPLEARHHYMRAVEHFERLRQPHSLAATFINLGMVDFNLGQLEHAIEAFQQGAIFAEECGSRNLIAYALTNQADAERLRGNFTAAYDLAVRSCEAATATGELRLIATSFSTLGAIECENGNMESGLARLRDCVEQWRSMAAHETLVNELSLLLEMLVRTDLRDETIAAAHELAMLFSRESNQRHPPRVLWALASAARRWGDGLGDATVLEDRARAALEEQLADMSPDDAAAYRKLPFNQVILAASPSDR